MLILTRRMGENVVVGDDIVISVLEVRGDAVRLGIQAPRSVSVHREEVYLELQRANREAAHSVSDDAVTVVAGAWSPGGQGSVGPGVSRAAAPGPEPEHARSPEPGPAPAPKPGPAPAAPKHGPAPGSPPGAAPDAEHG